MSVRHLQVRAHAKVNLSLEVESPRADGYHPYESLATSVGIADLLAVVVDDSRPGRSVTVTTSSGIVDTLATAAAHALLDRAGTDAHVSVTITKRIPAGAGLGGGSADAAATLVAVDATLGLGLGRDALEALAVPLGTDVPFAVGGGFARLHGRGELVDARPALAAFGILVAVPPVHVPTGPVFAAFDAAGRAPDPPPVPDWLADAVPGCSFRNDLEPAALAVTPGLADWRARIVEACDALGVDGGVPVRMTGSGAGFVAYAATPALLEPAAAALRAGGIAAWATCPVGVGSVIGHDGAAGGDGNESDADPGSYP